MWRSVIYRYSCFILYKDIEIIIGENRCLMLD